MADVGAQLRTYLIGITAVSDLIGTRCYPDGPPQGATLPCLAYTVVDTVNEEDLEGSAGLAHSRVQIDAYAATRKAANALANAVQFAPLQGFRGNMGTLRVAGVSLVAGPRYGRDEPVDGSDTWRYLASQDFRISHEDVAS